MTESKIEWTERTWNPVRGCRRVSPGCQNCYAERMAHRFSGPGRPYEGLTVLSDKGPRWSGEARFVADKLDEPLRRRTPTTYFVNSMSDLFHEDVTDDQIAAVFGVMGATPRHTYQVLTKRPRRALEWFRMMAKVTNPAKAAQQCAKGQLFVDNSVLEYGDAWPLPNVWIGVSVEDQQRADERIPLLLEIPAAVRFLSMEPLLGPVALLERWLIGAFDHCPVDTDNPNPPDYEPSCAGCPGWGMECAAKRGTGLDWVIVGGESGPGARRCHVDDVRSIVRRCQEFDVPVFVKQLGALPSEEGCEPGHVFIGRNPRSLHAVHDKKGGNASEWPEDLRVRQMPLTAQR